MDMETKDVNLTFQPNPRGLIKVLACLLVAALVIFLGARTYRELREARVLAPQNVVQITGEGKVKAKPDIGQVTLTIQREAKSVAVAQKDATDAANKVFDFLKSKGIEDKDITTDYSIYPRYDYIEKRGQVLRGYQVRQGLTIKFRNLDVVGDVLTGVADRGVNEVGNLSFTTEDPEKLRDEARAKAINAAKEKARELEKELGVKFGSIVSFTESSDGTPPIYFKTAGVGLGGAMEAAATPIPTGENEFTVTVTLVYEIL